MDRKIYTSGASSKSSSAPTQTVNTTDLSVKQVGGDSRQALTKAIIPGINCLRPMDSVSTPDGHVQAIVMADTQDMDIHPDGAQTVNGYDVHPHFISWETLGSHASTDKVTYDPYFSKRVKGLLKFHGLWRAMYVYKLVSKIPLTANTRVFVSWSPLDSDKDSNFDTVGFEWSPTETNTIYVLAPWSDPSPLCPSSLSSGNLRHQFGGLTLQLLGSTADIDPVISVYGAPTNLTGHGLDIYTDGGNPGAIYEKERYKVALSDLPNPLVIDVASDETVVVTGLQASVFDSTTPLEITPASDAPVGQTFILGGPESNEYGAWVPEAGVLGPGRHIIKFDNLTHPASDVYYTYVRLTTTPFRSPIFQEQIDAESTDFELPGSPTEDVIPTKPPALTPTIKEGNHSSVPSVPVESLRETNQFYPISTTSITDETFGLFTLNSTVDRQTFNVNTCRFHLLKKYPTFKLKATTAIANPAKLRIVQIPFWTKLDEVTFDDLFELPGIEWDVKDGDLDLSLYWDDHNPAKEIPEGVGMLYLTPPLAYQVISRNGNEPIPVSVFLNIADDNFAAVREFVPLGETADTYYNVFTEQMDVDEQPSERFNASTKTLSREQGPTVLSTIWNYVSSTQFSISDTEPSLDGVIAVDPRNFGPYLKRESRRYALWQGDAAFKILFQTPRTIAGTLTVAHVDTDEPKTTEQLRQYPHVITQDNSEVQLSVKWRKPTPWLRTGISDTAEADVSNGYIYFKFEPVKGISGSASACVTVYSDSRDVQLVRPRAYTALESSGFRKVKSADVFEEQMDEDKPSRAEQFAKLRLSSFPRPDHPWARQLADNGFMYARGFSYPDAVVCTGCGIIIAGWELGDYIPLEHQRHAEKRCLFLEGSLNDYAKYSPYTPKDLNWFFPRSFY